MNKLNLVCLLVLLACCLCKVPDFDVWKKKFDKKYISEEEENYRRLIYQLKRSRIELHNMDETNTYKRGVNQFSDFTDSEYAKIYLIAKPPEMSLPDVKKEPNDKTPKRNLQTASPIDWAALGKVSPVKNMVFCGVSWIFAATSSIESAWMINNNTNISISDQQILDCTVGTCGMGFPYQTFDRIRDYGVNTTISYLYWGEKASCIRPYGPYKISSYNGVYAGCESHKVALQTRPIYVFVDATNWYDYESGIVTSCGGYYANFYALLVGYTTTYWKIKNAFGTQWGEDGFMRLAMSSDANGTCWICYHISQTPIP